MTDRQREMIEAYIPNPKDDTLEDFEYYWMSDTGKIYKVYVSDINPLSHDRTGYGCRYSHNGNKVHAFGEYESITMNNLYDNYQDCKDQTHLMFERWEELRELQKGENE